MNVNQVNFCCMKLLQTITKFSDYTSLVFICITSCTSASGLCVSVIIYINKVFWSSEINILPPWQREAVIPIILSNIHLCPSLLSLTFCVSKTPQSPSTHIDLTYYLKAYPEQTGATGNDTLQDFHYVSEDVNPTWHTTTLLTLYGIKSQLTIILVLNRMSNLSCPSGLYIFPEGSKCNIFILVHENEKL